jgi:hypothetical protein
VEKKLNWIVQSPGTTITAADVLVLLLPTLFRWCPRPPYLHLGQGQSSSHLSPENSRSRLSNEKNSFLYNQSVWHQVATRLLEIIQNQRESHCHLTGQLTGKLFPTLIKTYLYGELGASNRTKFIRRGMAMHMCLVQTAKYQCSTRTAKCTSLFFQNIV